MTASGVERHRDRANELATVDAAWATVSTAEVVLRAAQLIRDAEDDILAQVAAGATLVQARQAVGYHDLQRKHVSN